MLNKLIGFFQLKPDYKKRVFGLDLMRAFAIIFVVKAHGSWILEKANINFLKFPLIDGVELFFVLSGFLIGGILIKIFQKVDSFNLKTIGHFWIRRWFRTLPNYYLILILNIIFVYYGVIVEDFSQFNWKFFLFLQNFSQPFYDFFWESWSLSIEEWFYLLFPLVLAANLLILKRLKINKRYIFLSSVIIFLLTPLLLRFFIASKFNVDQFWLGVKIYKVVIYRLDGIALGLLAAYIKFWNPDFWFKSRNITFIIGLVLSYTILYWNWEANDFSTKVLMISLQSIGCFLLLPKFDSLKSAPRLITTVVTHISLISYSMYLINLALVSEVIRDNFQPHGPKTAWAMYVVYWFVVIFMSTLIYKYYEKPFMDLRDKFKQ